MARLHHVRPWVGKRLRDMLCHRLALQNLPGDFMYFDLDLTAKEVMEKMWAN